MNYFISVFIFLGFMYILDTLLKQCGVTHIKLSETDAKHLYKWGSRAIIALFVCVLFPLFIAKKWDMKWSWIIFISMLWGFQAILEWIYTRETKQYISTILFAVVMMVIAYHFIRIADFIIYQ